MDGRAGRTSGRQSGEAEEYHRACARRAHTAAAALLALCPPPHAAAGGMRGLLYGTRALFLKGVRQTYRRGTLGQASRICSRRRLLHDALIINVRGQAGGHEAGDHTLSRWHAAPHAHRTHEGTDPFCLNQLSPPIFHHYFLYLFSLAGTTSRAFGRVEGKQRRGGTWDRNLLQRFCLRLSEDSWATT